MIRDVLPDTVWEVVQSHFAFDYRVRFSIWVSLGEQLDKTYEQSVCAFFSDGVRAEYIEGLFGREAPAVDHVHDPDADVFVDLHVHSSYFEEAHLQLVLTLLVVVAHDARLVQAAQVLEGKATNVLRHTHELLALFEHQFVVPV